LGGADSHEDEARPWPGREPEIGNDWNDPLADGRETGEGAKSRNHETRKLKRASTTKLSQSKICGILFFVKIGVAVPSRPVIRFGGEEKNAPQSPEICKMLIFLLNPLL
jgi:hypothetical protein